MVEDSIRTTDALSPAEMALAHVIKDKTEAAYRRGALLKMHRELPDTWADYCVGI